MKANDLDGKSKCFGRSRNQQRLMISQDVFDKTLQHVLDGNCCRVLGPRFRGKSKLMREVAATLDQLGTHQTCYQSLLGAQLESEAVFFTSLYSKIKDDISIEYNQGKQIQLESALEFQYALHNIVKKSDRNIALFFDDLEIPPPNLVASLLGVSRALFSISIDQPCPQLQVIVCGALSLNRVALESASRFESVSDLVLVNDLDEKECFDFLSDRCSRAVVLPTQEGIEIFFNKTGGDPILIDLTLTKCFEQMKINGLDELTPACVKDAVDRVIADEPNWQIMEIIRQMERNPVLLSCSLQMLEKGEMTSSQLPVDIGETPTPLDLCGVFTQNKNGYKIKCEIWSKILQQHLTSERTGSLYAIAGYWKKSIRYFGDAVQEGQNDVISELIAAVINAINAISARKLEEVTSQAFEYLVLGLKAAYPDRVWELYQLINDRLVLVHPAGEGEKHRHIELDDLRSPEVKALYGPSYSVASTSMGTSSLIPLRTRRRTHAMGLLVIKNRTTLLSLHRQREQIMNLIDFLQQATQAIETKVKYIDLLDKVAQEAKLRQSSANIASGLIHEIYGAVANIPDLVAELNDNLKSDDDYKRPLQDLERSAFETDRLSRKLKEILISGRFNPEVLKLGSYLEDTLDRIKEKITEVGIRYESRDSNPRVAIDQSLVEYLLKNLLVNASEAILPDQDGLIQVSIHESQDQESASIRVCDNGPGIVPKDLPYIFDFGFTTKDDGRMRGIGLYQCRQIAKAHGGSLTAKSTLGKGSVFTLSLPIED